MTDHITIGAKLKAYRGDALRDIPIFSGTCLVVAIEGMPSCLTLHECEQLAEFIAHVIKLERAAKERARNLAECSPNAPNLCKACGHLNGIDNRGWCRCGHCGAWMDRGPFPGQSAEEHEARGPSRQP